MTHEFEKTATKEEPSFAKEGSIDRSWGIAHDLSHTKKAIENVHKISFEKEGFNLSILCSERALETVGELDSSAISLLARALQSFCKDLYAFLLDELGSDFAELSDFHQDLSCPVVSIWFYRYVRRELGQRGKTDSKKWQEKHSETRFSLENQVQEVCWDRWLSEDYRKTIFPALARTLWDYSVSTEWKRQKENAAVPKAYMDLVVKPSFYPKKVWGQGEQQGMVFNQKGELALTVPSLNGDLLKVVSRGIEKFHSITAHRILRWEIQTCFDQWVAGDRSYGTIYVEGGFSEVARRIGYSDDSPAVSDVKDILVAQSQCYVNAPKYRCSSLILLEGADKKKDGNVTCMRITLPRFLLPGFCLTLDQGSDRRLVPILPLPGLFGSPNSHAGQARLHLVMLEFLSDNSDELVERGWVLVRPRDISLMANAACIEEHHVQRTLHVWCEDSPDSPAFLKRNGEDYTLSHHHQKALDFLLIQGQKRVSGKKGEFAKKWKRKPKK